MGWQGMLSNHLFSSGIILSSKKSMFGGKSSFCIMSFEICGPHPVEQYVWSALPLRKVQL